MKTIIILSLFCMSAFAQELVINGAEFGIGKFHRKDNKLNKYQNNNVWKVFVLPENADTSKALVQKNSDSNYTVFFTNLEEFLVQVVKISNQTGKKVGIINMNAHGIPGGMWFPATAAVRDSWECNDWRKAATESDDENYDQYYSAVTTAQIRSFEAMSYRNNVPSFQCMTGVKEWATVVAKVPELKTSFADNAQIHMLSCVVGMGTLGDKYTLGLANTLFSRPVAQQVQTAIKFGLGDWSLPIGLGFWGYENDAQMSRDNARYPVQRRDSEIIQKGNIRIAEAVNGKMKSGLIENEDYMYLERDSRAGVFGKVPLPASDKIHMSFEGLRIPGTKFNLRIK